jgi:hypothetical protein
MLRVGPACPQEKNEASGKGTSALSPGLSTSVFPVSPARLLQSVRTKPSSFDVTSSFALNTRVGRSGEPKVVAFSFNGQGRTNVFVSDEALENLRIRCELEGSLSQWEILAAIAIFE